VTIAQQGGLWTGTGTTTLSVIAADASVVGYFLVARIVLDNSGASGAAPTIGITDSHTSWTVVGPANRDPGAASAGITTYIAYGFCATTYSAGSDTVNISSSPSVTQISCTIAQWSGVKNPSPVSVSVVTASGGSTAPAASISPLAAGELVVVACGIEGNSADRTAYDTDTTNGSWAAADNWTQQQGGSATATDNITLIHQSKIVTASGAQAWGATLGTSRDWAVCAIVFAVAPVTTSQSVSGGLTPGGAEAEQTQKRPAGAMTPAGTEAEQTQKRPAGAMTPAGTLTKSRSAAKGGGSTPTGAETRVVGKTVSGVFT